MTMSKYTTSIAVIINSQSHSVSESDIYGRIEEGRKFLFDFDYPVPNADFKKAFETQFIEKYWQDEIGFETVPLFKMKLKQKLEMMMPEVIFKYNTLQDIMTMENPSLERSGTSSEDSHQESDSESHVNGSGTTNGKTVSSNTPADIISASDIGSVKYASMGGMNNGENTSRSDGTSSSNSKNSIERNFSEYGNQLKGYLEWYQSYVNIMNELLVYLDSLFLPLLW